MNRPESPEANSSVGEKNVTSSTMTTEEARDRFLASASYLDKEFGLDTPRRGVFGTALFALSTIFTLSRSRSWAIPLVESIMSIVGKVVRTVFGVVKPRAKKRAVYKKSSK